MDSSISNDGKKSNLEDLSKEELLKKCKGLLTIAQKAKQAKDVLHEENAKLKQELTNKSKNSVSEELVESLTQQKLSLVTTIEDLKAKNTALDSKLQIFEKELQTCQEKLNTADNESVSYKRQVVRLTDENEQLITHLDSLEKQIDELNKIGIQQRQQLLALESNARDNKNVVDDNKITELQCMLSVSLEEVKKLKSENIILNEKVENLNINLSEKNKNILLISEELKSKCDTLEKVALQLSEIQSNKETRNDILEDYEKLKSRCQKLRETNELLQKDCANSRELDKHITELTEHNERLKEKLKLYHSKIIKFAGSTKAIKEEKNVILQLFKQYTEQVKEWKEQLNSAAKKLVDQVTVIQSENQQLTEQLKRQKQEDNNRQLSVETNLRKELDETISNYEVELKVLKEEKEANADIVERLQQKELECLNLAKTVEDSTKIISEYKREIEILQTALEEKGNELTSQENLNSKLDEELALAKNENMELIKKLNESDNSNRQLLAEINLKEQLNETIANYELELKTLKEEREENAGVTKKLQEKELECISLAKTVENSTKVIDEYKTEIEILRTTLEEKGNELTSQEILNSKLEEELILMKNENTELIKKSNESEKNRQSDIETNLKKELNETVASYELQLKALKEDIEANADIAKKLVEKELDCTNLSKTVEDSTKIISEHKNEIEILRTALEEKDNALTSQETLNSKLDEELALMKNKYTDALKKLNESDEKNNLLDIETNKELKETITNYELELRALKEENEANADIAKKLQEKESDFTNLTKTIEDSTKTIKEYKSEIEILRMALEDASNELTSQVSLNAKLNDELTLMKNGHAELTEKLKEFEKEGAELHKEIQILQNSNSEMKNQIDLLITEKKSMNIVVKENDASIKKQLETYQNKLLENERLVSNLQAQLKKDAADEKKLAERSGEEIVKLVEEIKDLGQLNNSLQEQLNELRSKNLNVFHYGTQTSEDLVPTNELEEQIANLKRENTELLSEMNEMNQALKERGENISKLEAHCEEVMKKLQIYETQANKNVDSISEKEEIIKKLTEEINSFKMNENNYNKENIKSDPLKEDEIERLRGEIENLKEKLNSNLETSYAESETMSTSTVSRTEDLNRLRDLEGSWEERYGKLRTLAIKLKGKIRELTNTLSREQGEKEELQKKLSTNLKTIQTLQNQCDKLDDELEKSKQECKQYLDRLNTIGEDISKDKQSLVSKDDIISDLRKEIETLKSEKQTTDNWKKQVSAKVQTLRKELEANNLLKKDFENKITKLTGDLEAKEQSLKAEIESHKQTKGLLDASNNECKKNSVLNLEMQDYERSVKETAKKLEKQQEQMTKWKGQVESQKSTINALREQNKMLEERIQEAEETINSYTAEINGYKKKVVHLEEQIQQKEEKIDTINELFESSRSENEELSTELSKVIAEHQKTNNILKSERDLLRSQTLGLQQNLREVQDVLRLKEDELVVIRNEYEGYKVRAQSVLRQNQNRDVGLEEKLTEEVANLKVQNSQLAGELEKTLEAIKALEEGNTRLIAEKEEALKKIQELEVDIEELKSQYDQLSSKHQTTLNEHAETVRSLKLHADTLSQCYRQQIADQESRHNREIIELQGRIEKCSTPVETLPVLPTSTREEGEGSESIESNNPPKIYPVPLERLLGSDSDKELVQLKKQLGEQESKLVHLTALLSDTEQDLAKHVQMNKLLKEEIRRQQRSEEREKHAENLEYLKNVVFKFLTLHSGDERSRLVPVLNTILKLSPEETHKLNSVAKGDTGIKGWANYLPTWSSPNKPS